MRLWALSDLHVSHPENHAALEGFPAFPDDWLILGGDVTTGTHRLDWCFRHLAAKFRQVVWVPGKSRTLDESRYGFRAWRRRSVRAAR